MRVYLLTDPDPSSVTAVAFAQTRAGATKLIQLDRPPETAWRRALEALAAEYLAGFAAVQPRDDAPSKSITLFWSAPPPAPAKPSSWSLAL
ncbi:MAG: hypothetical protein ACRD04_08845 [Terriglobales bacterium]